ncbi:hypothetical protein SAMN05421780_101565 [Flexibacter flexilis DSM 6793]|uniref:Uncharacterized protein n=1 Tax=Flexibacter flexilis DSM 6793 TaxID=927664 RepID=A0A1I1E701_9BACT|nr:hypothetical protein [Flexibacter flexilis]SFB80710.1 hypothetical protein SAMN05421780_101565 [Flexibacter flexilis DSM 6793]
MKQTGSENVKYATPDQKQYLAVLCKKNGIDAEAKKQLVSAASEGRAESSDDLYLKEAQSLIKQLVEKTTGELPITAEERMRSKIISVAHQLRWKLPDGRADIERLNNWCIKYGAGVTLNQANAEQLRKMVTAIENILKQQLNQI